MVIKNQYSNSGVDGAGGYEFQKHCALYIFLKKYEDIKDSKYFICLEHYEDFLFCYLDKSKLLKNIDTYQAKKSSKNWTLTKDFKDIIQKILQVGIDLKNDTTPKASNYFHNLHFITNHSITLVKNKVKNIINERDSIKKFDDLYDEIKEELETLTNENTKDEINHLVFSYLDFNKTPTAQKQYLVGIFSDIFGAKILDHKASIDTLLSLFRDAENTLNQGNIVKLMDKSKRVESEQINKTLNILTVKQKAFDEWRAKKDEYSKLLKINPLNHNSFELAFENAFDYFKDLNQIEHHKIFNFVQNINLNDCFSDTECLEKIIINFQQTNTTQFDNITTKASIMASYIQLKEVKL